MAKIPAMEISEFWKAVKRWRMLFFLWWIGWPPLGAGSMIVYRSVTGHEPPEAISFAQLFAWVIVWNLIAKQLRSLPCPRCGQPAIRQPYFFMRDAKCQHCGLAYRSR